MTSTTYLAQSVETARIASAERQMEPPPSIEFPFDIEPVYKNFHVYLPPPYFFAEIDCPGAVKEWGLKFVRFIFSFGNGHYSVQASHWASAAQVAEELEGLMLPF
ncbi:MAG: hypothetical protein GC192_16665 [Bacteroidetes bacterium]|nr:hypothetical protein [Bacteroidota bacterium]